MYKMYGLVLYNLSPIQQGIQFGHAVVEYLAKHLGDFEAVNEWIKNDKTFIILNGGTSETLKSHIDYLNRKELIRFSTFQEPDLGGITTCVCFLAKDGDDITKYFTPLFRLA